MLNKGFMLLIAIIASFFYGLLMWLIYRTEKARARSIDIKELK